jgi:hypothetical protein
MAGWESYIIRRFAICYYSSTISMTGPRKMTDLQKTVMGNPQEWGCFKEFYNLMGNIQIDLIRGHCCCCGRGFNSSGYTKKGKCCREIWASGSNSYFGVQVHASCRAAYFYAILYRRRACDEPTVLSSWTVKSPELFTLSEWFTILERNCGPDVW